MWTTEEVERSIGKVSGTLVFRGFRSSQLGRWVKWRLRGGRLFSRRLRGSQDRWVSQSPAVTVKESAVGFPS